MGCFHGDSCTYNKLNACFQFSMVIVLHVIRYSFTIYSGGLLSNFLASILEAIWVLSFFRNWNLLDRLGYLDWDLTFHDFPKFTQTYPN